MRSRHRAGSGRRVAPPGVVVAAVAWLMFAASTLAASPSAKVVGGDPRSSGQGPGLVGDPAFALLAVIAIGLASLVATLIYVRLTAPRSR